MFPIPPPLQLHGRLGMFRSARLSLQRAEKHISDFKDALDKTFVSRACSLRCDGRHYPLSWFVTLDSPFPEGLMLVVGDAVHNLRTALDHCVWEMTHFSRQALTPRERELIAFPTNRNNLEKYRHRIKTNRAFNDSIKQFLMTTEAFPEGAGEALLFLHQLDIEDKHSITPPVVFECVIHNLISLEVDSNFKPVETRIVEKGYPMWVSYNKELCTHFGAHYGIANIGDLGMRNYDFDAVQRIQNSFSASVLFRFENAKLFPGCSMTETLGRLYDTVLNVIDRAQEANLGFQG